MGNIVMGIPANQLTRREIVESWVSYLPREYLVQANGINGNEQNLRKGFAKAVGNWMEARGYQGKEYIAMEVERYLTNGYFQLTYNNDNQNIETDNPDTRKFVAEGGVVGSDIGYLAGFHNVVEHIERWHTILYPLTEDDVYEELQAAIKRGLEHKRNEVLFIRINQVDVPYEKVQHSLTGQSAKKFASEWFAQRGRYRRIKSSGRRRTRRTRRRRRTNTTGRLRRRRTRRRY
ncbi:MAG TPA: hypothetical protein V6C97_21545 [Oculatellaceae cyanobacterium]